jgi:DNA-binding NtrC family response regulator
MPDAATRANILIVDDDQGLLRLLERTLKREGFITATVGSGKDAIAWLAENTTNLMLLDLKLQDIEGRELINHLAGIEFRLLSLKQKFEAKSKKQAVPNVATNGCLSVVVCISKEPLGKRRLLRRWTHESL